MKKLRAIFCIIFCSVLLFACSAGHDKTRKISDAGTVSDSSVAEINLYAYDGKDRGLPLVPNMGHAFISVKNLSGEAIKIANYPLEPFAEVSIGTWGINNHWGVWYNLETYYLKQNIYSDCASVKRSVSSFDDLNVLSEFATKHDYWTFDFNCSAFAAGMWNSIAGGDKLSYKGLLTPGKLKSMIREFTSYETERKIDSDVNPSFFDGDKLSYVVPKD